MGWRRLGTYLVKRLTRLPGSPHNIAAGVACGAAISFTPFVGAHLALAFLLAYLVRGQMLAAAVGTLVGNPWTFPLIWLITYKLGQLFLGSADAASWPAVTMFRHIVADLSGLVWPLLTGAASLDQLRPIFRDLGSLIWPMTIGSLPLALIAWLATYLPLVRVIAAYQEARRRRRARRLARLAVAPTPTKGCAG